MELGENIRINNPIHSSRLDHLAKAFSPGARVVYGRRGERILEGVILKIEGKYAVVEYRHLGQTSEDRVLLEKLNTFNPQFLMAVNKT